MNILLAVLKFTLKITVQIVLAAIAGGAKTNDSYSTKVSDTVIDKNGNLKFRNDNVEYL